jgi:hypothetical protein
MNNVYNSLCLLRLLLFQTETDTTHPRFARADRLSGAVIGAAIAVHRIMGRGLLASVDERVPGANQT